MLEPVQALTDPAQGMGSQNAQWTWPGSALGRNLFPGLGPTGYRLLLMGLEQGCSQTLGHEFQSPARGLTPFIKPARGSDPRRIIQPLTKAGHQFSGKFRSQASSIDHLAGAGDPLGKPIRQGIMMDAPSIFGSECGGIPLLPGGRERCRQWHAWRWRPLALRIQGGSQPTFQCIRTADGFEKVTGV